MVVLIVAGGAGTRLWPLSVSEYPKHLLTIVGTHSLVQNTFERAKGVATADKIYISTEAGHAHHIMQQLPGLSKDRIIIEPARRDTMPCILNALQYIATRHGHDEPVASIHADHHIRDVSGFRRAIKVAADVSEKYKKITLLGMEPTHPDSKYGYIHKGEAVDEKDFIYKIASFKEKPDYTLAQKYFESGEYYWNMGYFVAPYTVFFDAIKKYSDPHWLEQLRRLSRAAGKDRDKIYLDFQKEAIDTALIEKVPELLVMPGTFDWMDVGSFDDIHKVTPQDERGNAVMGQNVHLLESDQVYVRNETDSKPVAVIGVDNVVVINTKNGVLVMRSDQSQRIKDVVNGFRKEEK